MKRLKIILHCKFTCYLLLLIIILHSIYIINKPISSKYKINESEFVGTITSIKKKDLHVSIGIRGKENLRGSYFLKDDESFPYNIGDIVQIRGRLSIPSHNTVPDLFDYNDYLKSKGESYVLEIDSIQKQGITKNLVNLIQRNMYIRLKKYKSSNYLCVFLLGDSSLLKSEVISSYQTNGISHLFSVSGMHLSFLSGILIFILSRVKFKPNLTQLVACFLLTGYMLLIGTSASSLRATSFFIFRYLFSLLKVKIPLANIFIYTIVFLLLINPYLLLDIGFQYSAVICFFLLISKIGNENDSKLLGLLKVSVLSFFCGLPISLYNFFEVNFLGIIYNLFFVPFVSMIVFPLSFLTFIFSFLDPVLKLLTDMLENVSLYLTTINIGKVIFMKPSIWWIVIYYIILIWQISRPKFRILIPCMLLILYLIPTIFSQDRLLMIDVGQGDSMLIQFGGSNVLIDTGGKVSKYATNSITKNTLLPLLKANGIRKLDYLILSHGDYDHMGEAINLVSNFKVETVIFNCGSYNDLERKLIKFLNKKKIAYYSCIQELRVSKYKLQFLNTREYDNENDNSNVIYLNYNNYKFLFMGDAGVKKEKDILEKYNLNNTYFLKVGHHGSNTSSSEKFINIINPKYSLISVGKNNRYGHPKESVLDVLSNSKIYRTDLDGSTEIRLNKSGYKIRTCPP